MGEPGLGGEHLSQPRLDVLLYPQIHEMEKSQF